MPHVRLRLLGTVEGGLTSGFGVPSLLARSCGTESSGQVVSLSSSGQNGRMESYKYHCRSGVSPGGRMTVGNSSASGVQGSFSILNATSAESLRSFTNTLLHDEEDILKWWSFLTPTIFFIRAAKKSVQSCVGTTVVPSGLDTSCAKLHSADLLTTSAIAAKLPTFVRL